MRSKSKGSGIMLSNFIDEKKKEYCFNLGRI